MSCRCFGISRQAYYTWYRRYQAEGVDGLRTRSNAPKASPNPTHVELVGRAFVQWRPPPGHPQRLPPPERRARPGPGASRQRRGERARWWSRR
ncbi:helix-turn-helix domain-containing protein [Streptomyces sp. NPDC057062]|uniref:helix-turn-helix domain-containing protein n=1 Tax=Streptomyces sp. NPDC057062 TaxID=3346011 RepID=UPI003636D0B7